MKYTPDRELINKLRCPHCGSQTELRGNSLVCCGARKHCYDLSASGYVNLLPPSQSGGGDSKEAVRARRDFLSGGYYGTAARELADLLTERLPSGSFVVDGGCGEGYYTSAIAERGFYTVGVDISKFAAEAAAKRASAKQMTNSLYVVSMVVSDEHGINFRKHHSPFLEIVPQRTNGNTCVHKYLCIIRCQIITIAATAAAQGYEFYHVRLI